MRIGVRAKSQRQGIGRKMMVYLFEKYPAHLSLDVSTDNVKAVQFYARIGLEIKDTYLSEEKVEFNKFETPLGFKYIEPEFLRKDKLANQSSFEEVKGLISDEIF